MNIIIDNIDFWDNFEAAKYWSIPKSHSPQKAHDEIKTCMLSGNYIGSRKVDGAWTMIIKDLDGNFHLRSRTKNVEGTFADKAEWVPQITSDLSNIPNGTVLLGEIYLPNNEGSRKVTSVFNCLKDKCLERQKSGGYLHFYIFDVLAYRGKALLDTPFEERIEKYLNYELFDVLKGDYIEIAEYLEGQELWDKCGELLNAGYEGVVIQRKGALYLQGKRKAWDSIKVKKSIAQTIDAFLDGSYKLPTREYNGKLIESWNYWENAKTGERSNQNMYLEYRDGQPWEPVTKAYFYNWASAVSISVMKDGAPFHIGWISGIPDQMKEEIITKNDDYRGQVYEISAMEVEQTQPGSYSLRHGKFVGPRPDKRAEDCDFSQIA